MICIECGNLEIDCLYDRYESDYIKLTICPECNKIVDKYIEFDNVILFIDVLLLKQQAYRHLAYNLTETEMMKDESTHKHNTPRLPFFKRYKQILRLLLMIMLFEVYLIWAYEEKKSTHSMVVSHILTQSVQIQYLFFILKLFSQQVVYSTSIILLFHWFGFTKQLSKTLLPHYQFAYKNLVLLTTILISSSIRLFPILMLIWPYDNTSISSPLINLVGFIILLESLHIITSFNKLLIFIILSFATIAQLLISRLVIITVVQYFTKIDTRLLLASEYLESIDTLQSYKCLIRVIFTSLY